MCDYNFLGLHEEILDDILYDFCRYMSGIEDPTAEVPMYQQIKEIEDYLNDKLTNKKVLAKILTDIEDLEDFGTYQSLPQAFGKLNEELLYKQLKKVLDEKQMVPFPNGEMNFPDICINGVPMDFKAVKCELTEKSIKIKYNNAIDSVYEVSKKLNDWFYNDIDCDLAKSFLIFTFYDEYEEIGKVRFLHFKIMPTLYCIQLTKDGKFSVKSPGEADEFGNHYKMKNSNVCVKLPTVDRTNEESLHLPSIEEKIFMVMEAVNKERFHEICDTIVAQQRQEIESYGYPGQ